MAKFSQGFMDVLSRTGTPQAAMQQGQQGPSDYGSLQRNLGAAFGMDQRSRPEMASAEIEKIDPKANDALRQSLLVSAKYEQDQQRKLLMMAKVAELDQAAAEQKRVNASKKDLVDTLTRLDPAKYAGLANQIIGGNKDAEKTAIKIIAGDTKENKLQGSQFDGHTNYVDSDGNYFVKVSKADPNTGDMTMVTLPVGDVKEPVGKLELASTAAAGNKELGKTFAKIKGNASENLVSVLESTAISRRTLELLKTVNTGGPIVNLSADIKSFLGTTPKDRAELELLLGENMLARLKPLFGGVISDSEGIRLEKLMASARQGGEGSSAKILALQQALERSARVAKLALNSKTFDEYQGGLQDIYSEITTDPEVRVWGAK